MKTTYIFTLMFLMSFSMSAQSIYGKWFTHDDEGKQTAIISLYEDTNTVYANIVDILDDKGRKERCTKCTGENLNRPLVGLMIIKDMNSDGENYTGGTILDYTTGEIVKCSIYFSKETPNMLQIKANDTIGFKPQVWKRMTL